jgi:4-diphosphocytidyl-2C-methyl-D-erythritol kinase
MNHRAPIPIESRLEGVNRQNLKIINFEHALALGLGLQINKCEFRVRKIVPLAMSCSINANNFWEQTQNNKSKGTLEREEMEETNRVMKINTNEHNDLFLEVWFQRTYSPLRRPQRPGLFHPFPFLNRSLRPVE